MAAIKSFENQNNGKWEWKNGSQWVAFDEMASKEIDDKLRSGLERTSDNRIHFALTQGPFFSNSINRGNYWIVATLNSNKTKVESIQQRNSQTRNLRNIKRTPPFTFFPSSKPAPNKYTSVLSIL